MNNQNDREWYDQGYESGVKDQKRKAWKHGIGAGTLASWLLIAVILGGMAGCPRYRVWQQEMEGKAELSRAEQNRQIEIEESKAKYEAANWERKADSVRAIGTADANRIIGESITPEYNQWLWIQGLQDGSSEVIYVPTETNLPLLEARNK